MTNLPARAGVYLLCHDITGESYVGSAGNIRTRVGNHLRELRKGKHPNRRMQDHATLHGCHFACSVLELTGDSPRFPRERHWCDQLKPTLNNCTPPTRDRRRVAEMKTFVCRFKSTTVARMDAFKERHSLKPSHSQMVEAALTEWLDRNEPTLSGAKPKR